MSLCWKGLECQPHSRKNGPGLIAPGLGSDTSGWRTRARSPTPLGRVFYLSCATCGSTEVMPMIRLLEANAIPAPSMYGKEGCT